MLTKPLSVAVPPLLARRVTLPFTVPTLKVTSTSRIAPAAMEALAGVTVPQVTPVAVHVMVKGVDTFPVFRTIKVAVPCVFRSTERVPPSGVTVTPVMQPSGGQAAFGVGLRNFVTLRCATA